MVSVKNQLKPTSFKKQNLNKSKGIFDDYAVRKNIHTREGTIQKVPVDENHITNKNYVDSLIRGNIELFLTEDASDIGTYFDLATDNTGNPEEDIAQSITGSSTTLIASFASILNETQIDAITDLELGIYSAHLHAEANFPQGMTLYFEFYRRTNLGVETLLGTSHDSDILTVADAQYEIHASITEDLIWNTGDRVVVKVYGRNTNSPAKTITLHVEGDTLSRVAFPAFIPPSAPALTDHSDLNELDYASAAHTGFEPAKGADDNFVTDAEKIVIGNTSGTNTGDNTTHADGDGSDHADVATNTAASHGVDDPNATSEPLKGADDNYVTDAEKVVIGNTSGTNSGDMSDANVKTAYENNADTNAFTDAEKTIVGNTSNTNTGDQNSHDALDDVSSDDHHTESHTVASHSDTTGTGAELDSLTDNSMVDTLHRHSELSASDGTPDAVVKVSAVGDTAVGPAGPTPVAGVAFLVREDQNGQTFLVLDNGMSGTGARTVFSIREANSAKCNLQYNNQSPNAWLHTVGTIPLYFGTNQGIDMSIDAQHSTGIGTTNAATSAKLDIVSTTGALILPRMTTTQKNALTAVNGMMLYDSTLNQTQTYENGGWRQI